MVIDKKWIDDTIAKLDEKLSVKAVKYKDFIPSTARNGLFISDYNSNPNYWTNGFWGGLMWLMYKNTGNEVYKATAETNEKMLDKALMNYDMLDHDNGFLWELTAGENYRITQNDDSRKRILYAADLLIGRYNICGNYITAWNDKEKQGWAIIDCMMNLPLLYHAYEITGNKRFLDYAMGHADSTLENHIRPDGSVNHIVVYDENTGEPIKFLGGQGFGEGSSWSRGQAWAIYGFAQSYSWTKRSEYLDVAKKVAHYFVFSCCDDFIPRTDFRSPQTPDKRDTSAGMIAAAGLLEIAKNVSEYEKRDYINAAYRILYETEQKYGSWDLDVDPIIQNAMIRYDMGQQYLIYSDYYFADALFKLKEII